MLESMSDPDTGNSIDAQLSNLRSGISDLGYEIDAYKTRTAAALGAGVFLLLLGAGAAYDLVTGKVGMWSRLGVTHDALIWITIGLGGSATLLLVVGFRRARRADVAVRARLEQMELEYAELLEHRDAGEDSKS
jgi:hypothetical protein